MFQLVVDAHAVSVVAQHSSYAVRVDGNPRYLMLRKGMGMNGLNISNVNPAGLMGDVDVGITVTPRFHRYGDVTATYIRRSELPPRIYAKHQYRQESEYGSKWCIIHSNI